MCEITALNYKSRNVTKLITKWKDSGLLGDLDRYSIHVGCDVINIKEKSGSPTTGSQHQQSIQITSKVLMISDLINN